MIEMTFSMDKLWSPPPWGVYEVVPLMDERGEVIVYAEAIFQRMATGLPREFFNGGMRDVDIDDPVCFADFMSKYGLVGASRPRGLMPVDVMDVNDERDVKRVDVRYRFERGRNKRRLDGRWGLQDKLWWYKSLQRAAMEADVGWTTSDKLLNNFTQGFMFVTAYEAKTAFEELLSCADVVSALLVCDEMDQVADFLGISKASAVDYVIFHIDCLNEKLKNMFPQMDLKERLGARFRELPFGDGVLDERRRNEGTFDGAVALQIYQVALKWEQYKVCKECGRVFAETEPEGRKGPSRSTARFCSSRCYNRYKQRERRRREKARKAATERTGKAIAEDGEMKDAPSD